MKISHRFAIHQKVFAFKDGEIISGIIKKIEIRIDDTGKTENKYFIGADSFSDYVLNESYLVTTLSKAIEQYKIKSSPIKQEKQVVETIKPFVFKIKFGIKDSIYRLDMDDGDIIPGNISSIFISLKKVSGSVDIHKEIYYGLGESVRYPNGSIFKSVKKAQNKYIKFLEKRELEKLEKD